ncbi:MAG: methyltransferase domain-containing protein [Thermodesulfobacteriota bacterium]
MNPAAGIIRTFNWLATCLRCIHLLPRALRLHRSPLFSAHHYSDAYNDIDGMFLMAELHFLRYGMYEKRNPHPLFNTAYYLEQVEDHSWCRTDPISHFLSSGAESGLNPHPLFNLEYYRKNLQEPHSVNPLVHYLTNPPPAPDPNPLFFTSRYLEQVDDVKPNEAPLLHYLKTNDPTIRNFSVDDLQQANEAVGFNYYIERFSTFQSSLFIEGWAFAPEKTIKKIGYQTKDNSIASMVWQGLPSSELVEQFGPSSASSRFNLTLSQDLPENHLEIVLIFEFDDGSAAYGFNLDSFGLKERPHSHFLDGIFRKMLHSDTRDAKILEIGSRNRSDFVSKGHFVPEWMNYTGTDIVEGDNVDVVCDAHAISSFFPHASFDYIFSLNVFEHLIVPWKVVLEINSLLKTGGKVMIFTHQTMPLHDTPCDYWRFSDMSWHAMFNDFTGFSVVQADMGEPVSVVARKVHQGNYTLSLGPAFLHSMVIAEKIAEPKVEWNMDIEDIIGIYPA